MYVLIIQLLSPLLCTTRWASRRLLCCARHRPSDKQTIGQMEGDGENGKKTVLNGFGLVFLGFGGFFIFLFFSGLVWCFGLWSKETPLKYSAKVKVWLKAQWKRQLGIVISKLFHQQGLTHQTFSTPRRSYEAKAIKLKELGVPIFPVYTSAFGKINHQRVRFEGLQKGSIKEPWKK